MKIALLEDDIQQAELVVSWLEGAGYQVSHRTLGSEFLAMFENDVFDMAILDWEVPDQTGVDVLRRVRNTLQSKAPIIFATQRDAEEDIVGALKAGADDYMIKPLRQSELLARLTALVRRAGIQSHHDILNLGPIEIDTLRETVSVSGEPVKVTNKDFQVAVCLLKNQGKVLSREYLLREVWGVDASLNTRTVDVHVSRVRRSLNITPEIGYCIKNIYQHGYRLEKVG